MVMEQKKYLENIYCKNISKSVNRNWFCIVVRHKMIGGNDLSAIFGAPSIKMNVFNKYENYEM